MKKALLWQISEGRPKRLPEGEVVLEKNLESWIEADPDLIQVGLTIVAKQMVVEAGRIDLLALDPAGRLIIVEIKRGTLYRETVAQGLDYAECINSLSSADLEEKCNSYLVRSKTTLRNFLEERDALDQLEGGNRSVLLYVVGTGKTSRLERLAQFLEKSIPIFLVVFDLYATENGNHILLRELSDADGGQPVNKAMPDASLEALCKQADAAGTGKDFRRLSEVGCRIGLYPRLWKSSVMFAPQESKNRMIFTVWTRPVRKKLKVYLSPDAIAEFYPIPLAEATAAIGAGAYHELSSEDVTKLVKTLTDLFSRLIERTENGHS